MDKEVWLNIENSEHEVSSLGNVRGPNGGSKQWVGNRGYKRVTVKVDDKEINGGWYPFEVHFLVARAFHGARPHGFQIDHDDDDQLNNRSDNLKYISAAKNIKKRSISMMRKGKIKGYSTINRNGNKYYQVYFCERYISCTANKEKAQRSFLDEFNGAHGSSFEIKDLRHVDD